MGKVLNPYKVGKHFELVITEVCFTFVRLADKIAAEAALDGLYIIRTSVTAQRMDAPTCARTYKSLAQVERAFRSIKTMGLKVRPIHHHLEGLVRAHIFCACWPTTWSDICERLEGRCCSPMRTAKPSARKTRWPRQNVRLVQ